MSNSLFRGKHKLFKPRQARVLRRLQIFTEAVASVASYVAMTLTITTTTSIIITIITIINSIIISSHLHSQYLLYGQWLQQLHLLSLTCLWP